MSHELTPDQARAALDVIERSRTDVAGQIDVPTWYWWLLATGWVVLGVIADAGHALLTTIATLVFGAVHAGLCGRAISGRHGSNRLSVHASLAPRQLPAVVIGSLLVLTMVTIGAALAVDADGAGSPGHDRERLRRGPGRPRRTAAGRAGGASVERPGYPRGA